MVIRKGRRMSARGGNSIARRCPVVAAFAVIGAFGSSHIGRFIADADEPTLLQQVASAPGAKNASWSIDLGAAIDWIEPIGVTGERLLIADSGGGLHLYNSRDGKALLDLAEFGNGFRFGGATGDVALVFNLDSLALIELGDRDTPPRIRWRLGGDNRARPDDPEFDNPIVACAVDVKGALALRSDGLAARFDLSTGRELWRKSLLLGRDVKLFAADDSEWIVTRPAGEDVSAIRVDLAGNHRAVTLNSAPPLWTGWSRVGLLAIWLDHWTLVPKDATSSTDVIGGKLATPFRASLFSVVRETESELCFVHGDAETGVVQLVEARRESTKSKWQITTNSLDIRLSDMRELVANGEWLALVSERRAALFDLRSQKATATIDLPGAPLEVSWRDDQIWIVTKHDDELLATCRGSNDAVSTNRLNGNRTNESPRIAWTQTRLLLFHDSRLVAFDLLQN